MRASLCSGIALARDFRRSSTINELVRRAKELGAIKGEKIAVDATLLP